MKNFVGIIPARYQSTRLPGKPLANICGKPMIQWVYERSTQALPMVYVATDDERIFDAVKKFKGNAVLTNPDHVNGTSRCLEAFEKISIETKKSFDVVINIQGDEPLIRPEALNELMLCFNDEKVDFATLAIAATDTSDFESNSDVWLVMNENREALYFSRSVIPFIRGMAKEQWAAAQKHYKHIGLYGYTPAALQKFASLPPAPLEMIESLEQLRWLENGGKIKVGITQHKSHSVDTPEDLAKVIALVASK